MGLIGQADHKVELDLPPPLPKGHFHTFLNVLLRDILVNDIPEALSTCLRGKSESGSPSLLDLLGQVNREGIRPQGGKRNGQGRCLMIPENLPENLMDGRVVGSRKGSQGELIVTGAL
ncbi:MAG: hypothetical protein DDT18_01814 [Actinobacteria bacterium]|nr:hypothetical protein [Actinomycetota bacterium]